MMQDKHLNNITFLGKFYFCEQCSNLVVALNIAFLLSNFVLSEWEFLCK